MTVEKEKVESEGLIELVERLARNIRLLRKLYIGAYATIMAGWITYAAFAEYLLGNIGGFYGLVRHVFDEGADKWGFVWTITVVLMEGGPGTMVLGAYEKHVLGPRRDAEERARQTEERARQTEERARQAEEQVAEGRNWNNRRLEAEARGERFDEPYPGDEDTN